MNMTTQLYEALSRALPWLYRARLEGLVSLTHMSGGLEQTINVVEAALMRHEKGEG